ncbi:glycosyltransferase family 9 protein [Candidatus Reidiella endopervernicosa]|uniref:Glycosyltransferase family 9 protein n=1 Tax=Candidatus Reidiella endopervernicosa TaxID=2738883 RepID=A0A6N0HZQ6_9GAMM|nr:glycosyltransferase family 9 protein [Candidatus Reidiella endopervernicosa]QKQ27877.1 glycosyltransferase family 9 protein [Candidatus Reidiella endopervernicosa]
MAIDLSTKKIRRILVIKWSAMGDVVIATTVIEDLRRAFPEAQIDLNTLPPWQRLFEGDERFGRVFTVDLRGKQRGLRGKLQWLREVRAGKYDLVVDLQASDHTRIMLSMLWLSGRQIPWRIGNNRQFPYNIQPEELEKPVHVIRQMRSALNSGGIPTETTHPVLHVAEKNRSNAKQIMQDHGLKQGGYALFMPGCQAAGYLKRWGAERYAELSKLLAEKGISKSLIIGGPDEMGECEKLAALAPETTINLCGKTEIIDIVPLTEGARFVVANDTGTAHVAAAANRPMLIVCGPTNPVRVVPVGEQVEAIELDLECMYCYCKHECDHHSCMVGITPEMVLDRLGLMGVC